MGLAIDKFCCIDSTDLLQKEQQNSSLTERSIQPENTFYNNFILSFHICPFLNIRIVFGIY